MLSFAQARIGYHTLGNCYVCAINTVTVEVSLRKNPAPVREFRLDRNQLTACIYQDVHVGLPMTSDLRVNLCLRTPYVKSAIAHLGN